MGALLGCVLAGAANFSVFAGEENIPPGVKIIATNDVHGNIYEQEGRKRLGYPKLRGYLDALEKEGWTTYLLDAGDAFSGNAIAQFDSGKSVAELMGKTGYRVLNPGNHAFDYNQSENDRLYYSNVLLPVVRANASGPVDVVSVNIAYNGAALPGARRDPVPIHEENGLRVFVAGVTTPYVATKTGRQGVEGYDFGIVRNEDGQPDHEATKARVLDMVARAVAPCDRPGDVVVVLSHLGWNESEEYAHGEITGRDVALIPNVDFVVDSHSHNLVAAEAAGAARYGIADRYMTHVAEITIAREGTAFRSTMEIKSYEELAGFPAAEAILAETRLISDRLGMGDRLFELGAEVDLSDKGIGELSTPLGRFVCREMLAAANADFAIFNAGGIRSGLTPGWVTVGDIYDVIPFQNNLQTYRLTGADVYAFFRDMPAIGTNGFPQFLGMTAYAWRSGNRYRVAGLLDAGGRPVDPAGIYTLATTNFLAEGGDGYDLPTDDMARDYGDFFTVVTQRLRNGGGAPESLNENGALLVFPDREQAEAAWRAACAENAVPNLAG